MAVARKAKPTRATKTVENAVASVALLTPKSAMDKLNAAKLAISDKLAEVDAAVLERIQEMNNLDIAIAQRKQEIKELHEIEVTAESLNELKMKHAEFIAESEAAAEKIENDHNEMIADRAKTWAREEADHKFEIASRNARDEAMLKAESETRQRVERVRAEDVDRQLKARIEAVELREKKMTDLEAQVAAMPGKIEEGIKSEVAKATAALKVSYEHAATVEKMNLDAKNKLLEAQIGSLQAQIVSTEKSRADAMATAEKARAELNQIAREAVQASSGREALQAVKDSAPNTPAPTSRGR